MKIFFTSLIFFKSMLFFSHVWFLAFSEKIKNKDNIKDKKLFYIIEAILTLTVPTPTRLGIFYKWVAAIPLWKHSRSRPWRWRCSGLGPAWAGHSRTWAEPHQPAEDWGPGPCPPGSSWGCPNLYTHIRSHQSASIYSLKIMLISTFPYDNDIPLLPPAICQY